MHPVMTFKNWAHAHHAEGHHALLDRLSQKLHSEAFWSTTGVIFALGAIAVLLYLTVQFGPMVGNNITFSNPTIFWTK